MFHYVYRIDNLINGKFYIGVHSGEKNPSEDNYCGSGKNIKAAIKKYGKNNFSKLILGVFGSRKEADDKEKELVSEDLLSDPTCYNIILGGTGNFWVKKSREFKKRQPLSLETRVKISNAQLGKSKPKHSIEANKAKSLRQAGKPNLFMRSPEGKKVIEKIADIAKKNYASGKRIHHYKGKHRSEEDKQKISNSLKGNIPWNVGIPMSLEMRQIISLSNKDKHVKIEKELIKINHTYDSFKKWVIQEYEIGNGPIKILKKIPKQCIISETPIKKIIKEHKDLKCQIL